MIFSAFSWRKHPISAQVAQVDATSLRPCAASRIARVLAGVRHPLLGHHGTGKRAERHHQLVLGHLRADQQRHLRAESQVDVIPRDRRVPPGRRLRTGNNARVRVPFDDLAARLQRRVVERVRQLAQAAANRRNHASLLQHATDHVSAFLGGSPDLHPETEHVPRQQERAVQRLSSNPQILHFALLEVRLGRAFIRPKLAARLAHDHRVRAIMHLLAAAQSRRQIGNRSPDSLPRHPNLKEQLGPPVVAAHASSRMIFRIWFRICHVGFAGSSLASISVAPPETVNGTEGEPVLWFLHSRACKSNSDAAIRKTSISPEMLGFAKRD